MTNTHRFRDYQFHLPAELQVFIGDGEEEMVIYGDDLLDYGVLVFVTYQPEQDSLRFISRWTLHIEHEGKDVTITFAKKPWND